MRLNRNIISLPKLLLMPACFLLIACSNSTKTGTQHLEANPELSGIWNDDNGCKVLLQKESYDVLLVKFDNGRGVSFANIRLSYLKDGVMTRLIPVDKIIPFYANYLEGEMIIDKYCKAPLTKIGK